MNPCILAAHFYTAGDYPFTALLKLWAVPTNYFLDNTEVSSPGNLLLCLLTSLVERCVLCWVAGRRQDVAGLFAAFDECNGRSKKFGCGRSVKRTRRRRTRCWGRRGFCAAETHVALSCIVQDFEQFESSLGIVPVTLLVGRSLPDEKFCQRTTGRPNEDGHCDYAVRARNCFFLFEDYLLGLIALEV